MSATGVVVVGDVMSDIVVYVSGPIVSSTDTDATILHRPGGSGANVAAWLGSLGIPTTMVGRVGDDAQASEAAAALTRWGVTATLRVDGGRATGACVVLVDASGERTMLPDAGANRALSAGDVPARAFGAGRHLHISGYTFARPETRAAAREVVAAARAAGMGVSIDAASAEPLATMGGAAFLSATDGVDLAFVTVDEMEVVVGTRDPGRAANLLLDAFAEVVLKLGRDGAVWASRASDRVRVAAAVPERPAVDTTGAGDAFAAGWLAARIGGAPPAVALRAACALAARCVTLAGARPR